MEAAFVSVYVDMSARADAVRDVVALLPAPEGVSEVRVDCTAIADTFGCKIAIDLTGTFDERADGPTIARGYAKLLTAALGVPAFALYDLLRSPAR
jgi:hypothetical protein